MSELSGSDARYRDIENELNMFSDSIIDPEIVKSIDRAREIWQTNLANIESDEDRIALISLIDQECWSRYGGKVALLTGYACKVELVDGGVACDQEMAYEDEFAEDWAHFTHGFTEYMPVSGESSLRLLCERRVEDEGGGLRTEMYAAPLESLLVVVDSPPSPEHQQAILESYLPKLTMKIDRAVLNSTGGIGNALLSLKGMDYDQLETFLDQDDESKVNYSRVRAALENYILQITNLDRSLPYLMDYDGSAYYGGDEWVNVEERGRWFSIDSFNIMEFYKEDGSMKLRACLAGVLHDQDESKERRIILLLDGIQSATSLRELIYP